MPSINVSPTVPMPKTVWRRFSDIRKAQNRHTHKRELTAFRLTSLKGLEYLPGKLPSCTIVSFVEHIISYSVHCLTRGAPSFAKPADTDINAVAKGLLQKLPDIPADFFTEDCLYRDMLSMSQSIRTIYGGDSLRSLASRSLTLSSMNVS